MPRKCDLPRDSTGTDWKAIRVACPPSFAVLPEPNGTARPYHEGPEGGLDQGGADFAVYASRRTRDSMFATSAPWSTERLVHNNDGPRSGPSRSPGPCVGGAEGPPDRFQTKSKSEKDDSSATVTFSTRILMSSEATSTSVSPVPTAVSVTSA